MFSTIAAALEAPGLALLLAAPPQAAALAVLSHTLSPDGWVLDELSGVQDAAGQVLRSTREPLVRLIATDGVSSPTEPQLPAVSERCLLRVRGPENAMPGINWALGFDATRVLEQCSRPGAGHLDWLITIEADEEEDIRERIACGVSGEAFRRDRRAESELTIDSIDLEPRTSLVLPEVCRAAAMSLPSSAQVLWSITPFVNSVSPLERCLAPMPFWVGGNSVEEVTWLAQSLPQGSVWCAHLRQASLPLPREVASLQRSGCGGVAIYWCPELEAATHEPRAAQTLHNWREEAGFG
jgi:hypothetical protein